MTPEKQIKALADLDGWTYLTFNTCRNEPCGCAPGEIDLGLRPLLDYLHSYDAIIPLIQKQFGTSENMNCDLIKVFWSMLNKMTDFFDTGGHTWMLKATPSQLCEALLRATGKWEE